MIIVTETIGYSGHEAIARLFSYLDRITYQGHAEKWPRDWPRRLHLQERLAREPFTIIG